MGGRQNSREQSEAPLLRDTLHPSVLSSKHAKWVLCDYQNYITRVPY